MTMASAGAVLVVADDEEEEQPQLTLTLPTSVLRHSTNSCQCGVTTSTTTAVAKSPAKHTASCRDGGESHNRGEVGFTTTFGVLSSPPPSASPSPTPSPALPPRALAPPRTRTTTTTIGTTTTKMAHKTSTLAAAPQAVAPTKRRGKRCSPSGSPDNGTTRSVISVDQSAAAPSGLQQEHREVLWKPFLPHTWHRIYDSQKNEMTNCFSVSVDSGFEFNTRLNCWVGNRRNHFQVHCSLDTPFPISFVENSGVCRVDCVWVHAFGIKSDGAGGYQKVELFQASAKRQQRPPQPVPLPRGSHVTLKLYFSRATANNKKKNGLLNPSQEFFHIVVLLSPESSDASCAIAAQMSDPLVIRGCHPNKRSAAKKAKEINSSNLGNNGQSPCAPAISPTSPLSSSSSTSSTPSWTSPFAASPSSFPASLLANIPFQLDQPQNSPLQVSRQVTPPPLSSSSLLPPPLLPTIVSTAAEDSPLFTSPTPVSDSQSATDSPPQSPLLPAQQLPPSILDLIPPVQQDFQFEQSPQPFQQCQQQLLQYVATQSGGLFQRSQSVNLVHGLWREQAGMCGGSPAPHNGVVARVLEDVLSHTSTLLRMQDITSDNASKDEEDKLPTVVNPQLPFASDTLPVAVLFIKLSVQYNLYITVANLVTSKSLKIPGRLATHCGVLYSLSTRKALDTAGIPIFPGCRTIEAPYRESDDVDHWYAVVVMMFSHVEHAENALSSAIGLYRNTTFKNAMNLDFFSTGICSFLDCYTSF